MMLRGREMKFFRAFLAVLALWCLLSAEDIKPLFAPSFTITYTPPNPEVWKVSEKRPGHFRVDDRSF
jgi:hypothetical protein